MTDMYAEKTRREVSDEYGKEDSNERTVSAVVRIFERSDRFPDDRRTLFRINGACARARCEAPTWFLRLMRHARFTSRREITKGGEERKEKNKGETEDTA